MAKFKPLGLLGKEIKLFAANDTLDLTNASIVVKEFNVSSLVFDNEIILKDHTETVRIESNAQHLNIYAPTGITFNSRVNVESGYRLLLDDTPGPNEVKAAVNVEYVSNILYDRLHNARLNDGSPESADVLWSSQEIQNRISNAINGLKWQQPVVDIVSNTNNPPLAGSGRYIVLSDDNIYNYDSVNDIWELVHETQLNDSLWVSSQDKNYTYNGSDWVLMGTTISHKNLQDLQGGKPLNNEFYHLSWTEYQILRSGTTDASGLHMHDSLYYTKVQLNNMLLGYYKLDGSNDLTTDFNVNGFDVVNVKEIHFKDNGAKIVNSTFSPDGKLRATESIFMSSTGLASTNIASALDELNVSKLNKATNAVFENDIVVFNSDGTVRDSGFYIDDNDVTTDNLWSAVKITNKLQLLDSQMFKHDGSVKASGDFDMNDHCIVDVPSTSGIKFQVLLNETDPRTISASSFTHDGQPLASKTVFRSDSGLQALDVNTALDWLNLNKLNKNLSIGSGQLLTVDSDFEVIDSGYSVDDNSTDTYHLWTASKLNTEFTSLKDSVFYRDGHRKATGDFNMNGFTLNNINDSGLHFQSSMIAGSTFTNDGKVKAIESSFVSNSGLASTDIASALDELNNKKLNKLASFNENHFVSLNANGSLKDSSYYVDNNDNSSNVLWTGDKLDTRFNYIETHMFEHDGSVKASGDFDLNDNHIRNLNDVGGLVFSSGSVISASSFNNSGEPLASATKFNSSSGMTEQYVEAALDKLNVSKLKKNISITSGNFVTVDNNHEVIDSGYYVNDNITTQQGLWTSDKINTELTDIRTTMFRHDGSKAATGTFNLNDNAIVNIKGDKGISFITLSGETDPRTITATTFNNDGKVIGDQTVFNPSSNSTLTATDLNGAINELDSKKATKNTSIPQNNLLTVDTDGDIADSTYYVNDTQFSTTALWTGYRINAGLNDLDAKMFYHDGTKAATGDFNLNDHKIINISDNLGIQFMSGSSISGDAFSLTTGHPLADKVDFASSKMSDTNVASALETLYDTKLTKNTTINQSHFLTVDTNFEIIDSSYYVNDNDTDSYVLWSSQKITDNMQQELTSYLKRDGSLPATGVLQMGGNNIDLQSGGIVGVNDNNGISFQTSKIIAEAFNTNGHPISDKVDFSSTSNLNSTNVTDAIEEVYDKVKTLGIGIASGNFVTVDSNGHFIDSSYSVDDSDNVSANTLWSSQKINNKLSSLGNYVLKSGDTMSGDLLMAGNNIDMQGGSILNVSTNSISFDGGGYISSTSFEFADGNKIVSTSFDDQGNVKDALAVGGKTVDDLIVKGTSNLGAFHLVTELPNPSDANEGDIYFVVS